MVSFHFIDRHGTGWMILPGLPADYPDDGKGEGFPTGLTFRASTGEVRVLPRGTIPRRSSGEIAVAPFGTGTRLRGVETPDWEALLQYALAWPPT